MKLTDPRAIVMSMITRFVKPHLENSTNNKTAEVLAHQLAGIRVSRHYRRDMSEMERNYMAREYLRGILTDRPV